jgi:hypothetical protein
MGIAAGEAGPVPGDYCELVREPCQLVHPHAGIAEEPV